MQTEPKKTTKTKSYDELTLTFEIESWDGRCADTKVSLNGVYICWISCDDIDTFAEQFFQPIKTYRI